jgi:regulator of nucleoside diphosphate kinase
MFRPHEQLQREFDRAIVVSSEAVPGDVATMNSRGLYVDETTGERRSVTIVYPLDADASKGMVSVLAPVGAALLGLSIGQAIEWEFPNGSRRRLGVEDVTYQPESRDGPGHAALRERREPRVLGRDVPAQ